MRGTVGAVVARRVPKDGDGNVDGEVVSEGR